MKRAAALYRALLHGYPGPFREEYGRQMAAVFADQLRDARGSGSWWSEAGLWGQTAADLAIVAPREHWHVIAQDLRYAFRTMTTRPGFAIVAVLSLALGIGANLAIFSLWHGVLHAPLPGVERPDGLVMLTDPAQTGVWTGRWNGRVDGPRAWVTYQEFEQLREQGSAFSSVMASQSSLRTWRVRSPDGAVEDAQGRLVSGTFFDVLGVKPAVGRLFTAADDHGEPSTAVISHSFWQRHFRGRADAVGSTVFVRDVPIVIVGVAPQGFVGETSGQRPDLWMPLRLQPRVLSDEPDRLHDRPPDKVMWLHVFGRVRAGVTPAQAEVQANAILQADLRSFYGAVAEERRAEFLDQRLRLGPGGRGASSARVELSTSLTMLLTAVGVLLLIACANLANLLLARGAAREAEIAIRVSLGASRGRLVRQLVTESLLLAVLGGIAAVFAALLIHGLLVGMLQAAQPRLSIDFAFTAPVMAFAVAATLGTALLFGLLPAWQLTRPGAGVRFRHHSRGVVGSTRELRAGRWLVWVQLGFSLPLLVGAGLLLRTAGNLRHPDLGFDANRLLLAQVDLVSSPTVDARTEERVRQLRDDVERIPGVRSVTYSRLGIFSGGESSSSIEVEGYTPLTERDRESSLDRVGAGYFATLGVPLRLGRDIQDGDRADSPLVCVVNEAFARRFFAGRSPLGQRVSTIHDNGGRTAYKVVGVAADVRILGLRGDVEPRFFVPVEQMPVGDATRVFLIRTAVHTGGVVSPVRETIARGGGDASSLAVVSMQERLLPYTAEDFANAWLAAVLGSVALTLAVIGLYGVISYGVSRRVGEMAVRIALGASPGGVIRMILAETLGLVAAGLALGGLCSYFVGELIAGRLYGVAPRDPLTLSIASVLLLGSALVAAYVPARRASKVNPIAALSQG